MTQGINVVREVKLSATPEEMELCNHIAERITQKNMSISSIMCMTGAMLAERSQLGTLVVQRLRHKAGLFLLEMGQHVKRWEEGADCDAPIIKEGE